MRYNDWYYPEEEPGVQTEFEHIRFVRTEPPRGIKTKRFECRNRRAGDVLGHVRYYAQWRQYVFEPTCDLVVFNAGCLRDIAGFLEALRNGRRRDKGEG